MCNHHGNGDANHGNNNVNGDDDGDGDNNGDNDRYVDGGYDYNDNVVAIATNLGMSSVVEEALVVAMTIFMTFIIYHQEG